MIEFMAGVGAGCVVLLAFFRWLWNRNTDVLIKQGPCAHCRQLLDVSNDSADYEHWRVCPKHPARAEVERLRSALSDLVAQVDAEPELDADRFSGMWPALSNARSLLLAGVAATRGAA